ncbi:hypothetical protein ACTJJE_04985 [Mycolicibacterium sp. 22603]|uniref:hypothetical protein n=1 Tax=Mycolicibacterium sp. 22603 TaxID=3453950 RepID=UPI003F87F700
MELLAKMQSTRSGNMLYPLPTDVVLTAALELLLAEGKCVQLMGAEATKRESTMLWCAFTDLMTGVHALAPETGAWWELSWQLRAGEQAEEIANWINACIRQERVDMDPDTRPIVTAASSETWPIMLTAAAVALSDNPVGSPVTREAIVTIVADEKMRRHIKPRQQNPTIIREITCAPVVGRIAEIIASALNASALVRADQLLVLRATAAGICASPWHAPQVVRHALLPAVNDIIDRRVSLHWMNQRQVTLSPTDAIAHVLANRWKGYSNSW